MSTIVSVKKAIIDLLKTDSGLLNLLTKDSNGDWPIYQSFVQHPIHAPCVTVEDVTSQGQVSGLKDGYDGSKRCEWEFAVVQMDCWSSKNPEERDYLQSSVMKCLLKGSNQDILRSNGIFHVQEPVVVALDELDAEPPLWRKSLRYRVFYILEVT